MSLAPLTPEAVELLMRDWRVPEANLAQLLGLDAGGMAALLAGAEPQGMTVEGALRLGVLIGALPGIASRRGAEVVRQALAGTGVGRLEAATIFSARTSQELMAALDIFEAALAARAPRPPLTDEQRARTPEALAAAVARIASFWQLGQDLERILGAPAEAIEASAAGSEVFERARLLVTAFCSLDAFMASNDEAARWWLRSANKDLGGVPLELMQSRTGLDAVAKYVCALHEGRR